MFTRLKTRPRTALGISGSVIALGLLGFVIMSVISHVTTSRSTPPGNFSVTSVPASVAERSSVSKDAVGPGQLIIPRLGINAKIVLSDVDREGNMSAPATHTDVGLYKNGPMPGKPGNAVVAGHLNGRANEPGVFSDLEQIKVGDLVHVKYGDNPSDLTFKVKEKQEYDVQQAPLERIFGPATASQLNLITCSGSYDRAKADYTKRLVVYAELIEQ
jgi:sortase A